MSNVSTQLRLSPRTRHQPQNSVSTRSTMCRFLHFDTSHGACPHTSWSGVLFCGRVQRDIESAIFCPAREEALGKTGHLCKKKHEGPDVQYNKACPECVAFVKDSTKIYEVCNCCHDTEHPRTYFQAGVKEWFRHEQMRPELLSQLAVPASWNDVNRVRRTNKRRMLRASGKTGQMLPMMEPAAPTREEYRSRTRAPMYNFRETFGAPPMITEDNDADLAPSVQDSDDSSSMGAETLAELRLAVQTLGIADHSEDLLEIPFPGFDDSQLGNDAAILLAAHAHGEETALASPGAGLSNLHRCPHAQDRRPKRRFWSLSWTKFWK